VGHDHLADPEHVGGAGLVVGDGHDLEPLEGGEVDPARVGEDAVIVEGGDRALEVQARRDVDGHHAVAPRARDLAQPCHPRRIGAGGTPHEERPAHAQDVASLERGRERGALERPVPAQGLGHGPGLAPPRRRPRHREEGNLVEDDGDVLDEAAVGEGGVGRQLHDLEAETAEEPDVGGVLGLGPAKVDRLPLEVGQLAAEKRRGDAPHDGDVGAVHASSLSAAHPTSGAGEG